MSPKLKNNTAFEPQNLEDIFNQNLIVHKSVAQLTEEFVKSQEKKDTGGNNNNSYLLKVALLFITNFEGRTFNLNDWLYACLPLGDIKFDILQEFFSCGTTFLKKHKRIKIIKSGEFYDNYLIIPAKD